MQTANKRSTLQDNDRTATGGRAGGGRAATGRHARRGNSRWPSALPALFCVTLLQGCSLPQGHPQIAPDGGDEQRSLSRSEVCGPSPCPATGFVWLEVASEGFTSATWTLHVDNTGRAKFVSRSPREFDVTPEQLSRIDQAVNAAALSELDTDYCLFAIDQPRDRISVMTPAGEKRVRVGADRLETNQLRRAEIGRFYGLLVSILDILALPGTIDDLEHARGYRP